MRPTANMKALNMVSTSRDERLRRSVMLHSKSTSKSRSKSPEGQRFADTKQTAPAHGRAAVKANASTTWNSILKNSRQTSHGLQSTGARFNLEANVSYGQESKQFLSNTATKEKEEMPYDAKKALPLHHSQ